MPFSEAIEERYLESERRENVGLCPHCEDYSFETGEPLDERVLCYLCGVCFKYHHDENFCELVDDDDVFREGVTDANSPTSRAGLGR